jgi:methionyl-tRNA synthetase
MLFSDSDTLADGWERREIVPGTQIEKPTPIFRKLDDSIIEEENDRLSGS